MNAMTIRIFLDTVYFVQRDLADSTLTHHTFTLRRFEKFLKREATLADLNEDTLNRHLADLKAKGMAPATQKRSRIDILGWWELAADQEPPLIGRPPRRKRIRAVREGRRSPVAWTHDEVRKLIETAEKLTGNMDRNRIGFYCPRSLYYGSMFRGVYDSALRWCDLSRVRWSDIRFDRNGTGIFVVTQEKTGDDVVCRFSRETMKAIELMLAKSDDRDLLWLWPYGREAFARAIQRIVQQAGVRRGTYKWFRRSSITAREAIAPGLGQLAAGHATPDMARRHYIDASQLPSAPLPPSVDAPAKSFEPSVKADGIAFTCSWGGDA